MKVNKGFELREMCGENIIIGVGLENIDFCRVISLNDSALFLWRKVEGREFTTAQLAEYLLEAYEVDEVTAMKDATELVEKWMAAGIITA